MTAETLSRYQTAPPTHQGGLFASREPYSGRKQSQVTSHISSP